MHSATLTLENAETVMESLSPESRRALPRTEVSVTEKGGKVTVKVKAADISAMRAALNSYLGFIKITEDIGNITR